MGESSNGRWFGEGRVLVRGIVYAWLLGLVLRVDGQRSGGDGGCETASELVRFRGFF